MKNFKVFRKKQFDLHLFFVLNDNEERVRLDSLNSNLFIYFVLNENEESNQSEPFNSNVTPFVFCVGKRQG